MEKWVRNQITKKEKRNKKIQKIGVHNLELYDTIGV